MMQIKKLTLTHKKDLRVILEDFQLVLNDGDKAVIIGEEGNGKSTLLKWMYDPALTEDYIESTGERIIGKERLGYLPQELPEAEKTKTVYEYFYEKEKFWDQTPKDLAVLARKFGLTEEFFYRDQQMSELSGGEKVKAQMMRLLMEDVTVLLLDEPSNDIDLATLELLEKLIREWEHIVVFISHDETLIENTANMVIHIEQIVRKTKSRYTVAKLPYRTYVEERLQNFERQEQKAQSDRREKALRDEKYRKVYQSVQNALNNCSRQAPSVAKNLKDKMHTVKAMNRRFEKEDARMTEMPEQDVLAQITLPAEQKKADIGIAMGGVGSDIALDAADIALVDDEVKELPHLIALSRRMMITIKCNMSFSMGLNFVAIVLAITGILNPVVGALVHNAGSVLVIINSALLLQWKQNK